MAPKQAAQLDSQPAEVLSLPNSVVSRVDVARLARELESLDELSEHQKDAPAPRLSRILEEAAQINHLDLLQAPERSRLQSFLKEVKAEAPTIHMSFAAEPPIVFTSKLITWLRGEIHPLLLLEIGLQPSIAAGCIIRTTNKYFDCSVRHNLIEHKPKLLDLIRGKQHA